MATSPTLAERAMACAGWHWLPGMADTDGNRCDRVVDGAPCFRMPGLGSLVRCPDAVPDLADGLTALGVLLLVRKAWGHNGVNRFVNVEHCSAGVSVLLCIQPPGHPGQLSDDTVIADGDTSAEALVPALECAP